MARGLAILIAGGVLLVAAVVTLQSGDSPLFFAADEVGTTPVVIAAADI